MARVLGLLSSLLTSTFRSRLSLQLEIAALRNRLSAYRLKGRRPHIGPADRLLWSVISKLWSHWREALFFVQPRTVTLWQQKRFRDYWRALSHGNQPGRPQIAPALRTLIKRMWQANPTWGSPRIVTELRKLGIEITKSTVEKYKTRTGRPRCRTWGTFLDRHVKDLVVIDFFVVPTVTFKVLFVFLVLAQHRRRVVHFNVPSHPPAQWTAQQIVEAFPFDTAPRYLLRDGDGIYGRRARRRIEPLGIDDVVTAPASPWQNAYVERVIGSLRRELLDHAIILNQRHLKRLLSSYFDYYHPWRTHRSLDQDAPDGRRVWLAELSQTIAGPVVHGRRHYCLPRAT